MVAAGSRIATLWSSTTEATGRDTVPEVGSAAPLASLRKVDLPVPFGAGQRHALRPGHGEVDAGEERRLAAA